MRSVYDDTEYIVHYTPVSKILVLRVGGYETVTLELTEAE